MTYGNRIARINTLKFSGNYYDSQNGEFWIACCDTYVLKKNPCYFGRGNQILLFGEVESPISGKVANNGTFTFCDHLKGGGLAFFAFDKKGNLLIQQKGEQSCGMDAISEDGEFDVSTLFRTQSYADCFICSNTSGASYPLEE
jgi:hypothetical protein